MLQEKSKKAVIYCRVSTKEQVEEGNSLNTQQRICLEYAQKNNLEVAAIFIEQGESAKTVDRKELKKLIAFCALKKNEISVVISYKIDRLSRNTDDYSQIRILLKRYGVEIKSTSEHFEDTPAGRFMENIIANVAQFDNDVRAERCAGGMKEAIREGRYVWQAPFGYSNTRVNGRATIVYNNDSAIIRKTFELIAHNQHPVDEVRKIMSQKGLIMANGKPISKSYFYRLIRNPLYSGWIHKFGETHKGKFEQIISDALYSKVQTVLAENSRKQLLRISDNPDFPLRRFIKHSSGKSLTGGWSTGNRKRYPYYIVHKEGINIRKEQLENTFIGWLNNFKIGIGQFEKIYSFLKLNIETKENQSKADQLKLETKIAELKAKQIAIVNKNIEGIISDKLCKERLAEIETELYDLAKAISSLPDNKFDAEEARQIIKQILIQPGQVWQKASAEEKIKLQWFYFPNGIEIDKNGSRTSKICKLFKLKTVILAEMSSKVDHRNQKLNKDNWQILSINDLDRVTLMNGIESNREYIHEMFQEIISVGEILKN